MAPSRIGTRASETSRVWKPAIKAHATNDFDKSGNVGKETGQADGFKEAGRAGQGEHENLEKSVRKCSDAKRDAKQGGAVCSQLFIAHGSDPFGELSFDGS